MRKNFITILEIFGTFVFFLAFCFISLDIWAPPMDCEIVLSPPNSILPGTPANFALYPFFKGRSKSVSGMKFDIGLRGPYSSRRVEIREEFQERRFPDNPVGCYIAAIRIPDDAPEGVYTVSVFLRGKSRKSLGDFPVRIQNKLLFAVLPPRNPVFSGDTVSFKVGTADPVLGREKPFFAVRGRMFSPEGFEIVNRPVVTDLRGEAEFKCKIHSGAPEGEYRFNFTAGNQVIAFKTLIHSAKVLGGFTGQRMARNLMNFSELVIPRFCRDRLWPPVRWALDETPPTPKFFRSVWKNGDFWNVRTLVPEKGDHFLELWSQNSLLSSRRLEFPDSLTRIRSDSIPSHSPSVLRIWTKGSFPIEVDETIIPAFGKTTGPTEVFSGILRDNFAQGPKVFQQLALFSGESLQGGEFQVQECPPIEFFRNLSQVARVLFPIILGFLIFLRIWHLQTRSEVLSAQLLVIGLLMNLFLLCISPENRILAFRFGIPALSFFLAFFILLIAWDETGRWKLEGTPIVRAGLFLSLLTAASAAFRGPWFPILPLSPLPFTILLAAISTPVFIALATPAGLREVPGFLLDKDGSLGSRFLWPLATRSWKGVFVQTLLFLGLFFALFYFPTVYPFPPTELVVVGDKVNHDPGELLSDSEKRWSFSQISPTDMRPLPTDGFFPIDTIASASLVFRELTQEAKRRFIFLQRSKDFQHRWIQRITVFLSPKDFLDRLVGSFGRDRFGLSSYFQEGYVRLLRFPLLSYRRQERELLELEALVGIISHGIWDLRETGAKVSRLKKAGYCQFLEMIGRMVFVDPAIVSTCKSLPTDLVLLPESEKTERIPYFPILETDNATETILLTPELLFSALKPGGKLLLEGAGGNFGFNLSRTTLRLSRGSSFRDDFQIKSLINFRQSPLLTEINYVPTGRKK